MGYKNCHLTTSNRHRDLGEWWQCQGQTAGVREEKGVYRDRERATEIGSVRYSKEDIIRG